MGYTLEEPLFVTAKSVGASHLRERVFILAHAPDARRRWEESQRGAIGGVVVAGSGGELGDASIARSRLLPESEGWLDATDADGHGGVVGHANGERPGPLAPRRRSRRAAGEPSGRVAAAAGVGLADACGSRQPVGRGERRDNGSQQPPADRRGGEIFAPGPGADWQRIPEALWPSIEPGFRLLVDGEPLVLDEDRAGQLRCGGNGCVALCAAVATVELMRRAFS